MGMFSSVAANGKLLGHCGRPGNVLVFSGYLLTELLVDWMLKGDLKMQLLGLMVGCLLVKKTVLVICRC